MSCQKSPEGMALRPPSIKLLPLICFNHLSTQLERLDGDDDRVTGDVDVRRAKAAILKRPNCSILSAPMLSTMSRNSIASPWVSQLLEAYRLSSCGG